MHLQNVIEPDQGRPLVTTYKMSHEVIKFFVPDNNSCLKIYPSRIFASISFFIDILKKICSAKVTLTGMVINILQAIVTVGYQPSMLSDNSTYQSPFSFLLISILLKFLSKEI